jgi:hypothetical protein
VDAAGWAGLLAFDLLLVSFITVAAAMWLQAL